MEAFETVRRPPVVLGMAAITALALLVAVGLILFSVNPTTHENQESIRAQQAKLTRSVHELNEIICSQAQTTANAYRFRSLTPSGRVEPIRHFLTRMQAQRQTLELSQGRDCPVASGFPPFGYQLERALKQIEHILGAFSAQQRKPVDRGVSHETPSQLQVSPNLGVPAFVPPSSAGHHAGIDESGIPYLPPPSSKHHTPTPLPGTPETTPVEHGGESRGLAPSPPIEGPQTAPETPESEPGPNPSTPSNAVGQAIEDVEEILCSAIREVHELCSSDE